MALEISGKSLSYIELRDKSAAIAATLQHFDPEPAPALTAVLAHRSVTAFAGILGTLLSGCGYLPINPNVPPERNATVLNRSGVRDLIVGSEAISVLDEILDHVENDLTVFLPDYEDVSGFVTKFERHTFVPARSFRENTDWRRAVPEMESAAYLLFTSGSTGIPKGVSVSHRSIRHFIKVMVDRYGITEQDRLSQMFELVFDLSLFDMFIAWECGACVCCPSKGDAQLPGRYINEAEISIWFSVPSLAVAMSKMRMLQPGLYPKLRLSLFCGEALLADTVRQWSEAAPNTAIENLYGPTEVTLACTFYAWDPDTGPRESTDGLVPIGYSYPGMTAIIVDESLNEVPHGNDGELLMGGPQVALGYWNDPQKTKEAFVHPPMKKGRFYRTGDLVRRQSESAPIEYRGRIDHQIKIRGNRIELGEIEAVHRAVNGVDQAIAVGWPRSEAGIDGITMFLQGPNINVATVKAHASSSLPSYMMPRGYKLVDEMPLNQNGKIDRKVLLKSLQES